MSKKQITLFQTWNKNSSVPVTLNVNSPTANINASSSVQQFPPLHAISSSHMSGCSPFQSPKYQNKDELADAEFDYEAGKTWIYPTNYPVRDYQFSIVQEALFKNTLVVLPTGLGKTFIAAVVMYNIYRWFPNGKVVFMAPTKPLVAQQIDACFNITGIPQEDTTQMTGTNTPDLRKKMWLRKRVFFLTPQVLVNDLVRNICPASNIKCLVVDEAHKALGNHAYCQVIKELCPFTSHFRVLALTATPGSETQAVKNVLSNLLISHVEVRSEDSEDVLQYTHIRDIEKIVVPLGDRLTSLKSRFLDIINMYLKRLTLRKVMTSKNPSSLSKFQILKIREAFSQNPPGNIDKSTYGLAMADFSLLISLYHAYELLLLHGATSFYNFLLGILNGDKSIPHARTELLKNVEFQEIFQKVKETYISDPPAQSTEFENEQNRKKKVLPGHPKLDKLLEVVLHHFKKSEIENIIDTRVMIFTQYRDSVQEIVDMLNQHQPMIKAMSFIGQSFKSASNVGYSQKQQLKVIQQFRSGGYNTLVSTCVGEEGLDIGEVDLIVCYDCPKSPIRLVQRMGRTGRLRKGRIIILIAEGKEEQMYNTCEYRKKSIHKTICNGFSFSHLYQNNPPLIPCGVKPVCVKTLVTIQKKKLEPKAKIVSKTPFLNDEEMCEFNQHVRVPEKDAPLLPKREFIILKNQEAAKEEATLVKPQISLADWTLWQTTPQRTDMIPHSSKSLLLVKTLEYIHFPEILASKKVSMPDFTVDQTAETKKFNSLSIQAEVPEIAASESVEEDAVEIFALPNKRSFQTDSLLKLDDSTKNLPLIKRFFDINVACIYKEDLSFDMKPPPSGVKIFSVEDFSSIDCNKISSEEMKGVSIIHILNKKMKAKLKKMSKELGRSVFSKGMQSTTPIKSIDSCHEDIKINKTELPLFNPEQLIKDENNLGDVVFNVDFDILGTIENEQEPDLNISLCSPIQNEQTLQNNKTHDSIDLNVDVHETEEQLKSSMHIEKINPSTISSNINNEKQCFDLGVSKITDNKSDTFDKTLPNKTQCIAKYLDVIPVLNGLSDIPNNNKQTLHNNENLFDSINFDIDFENIQEDSCLKHTEKFNLSNSSPRPNGVNNSPDSKVFRKVNDENNLLTITTTRELDNDQGIKGNKEGLFNISSHVTEKNQPSVLKDMKNICHLAKERSTEVMNMSDIKVKETVGDLNQFHTEISEDFNFISSTTKNKGISFESLLSVENKNDLQNSIHDYNTFGNKHMSFKRANALESDIPTKENDDINAFNISSNNYKKCKLSLKDNTSIQILNGIDKNASSKNSSECSKNSKHTNISFPANSKEENSKIKHSLTEKNENDSIDCNFDFDVSFGNMNEINDSSYKSDVSSESIKIHSVSKNLNSFDHLDQFDKEASSILEQLSKSQKNMSTDLNSSFSSPLTVKRCISEVGKNEHFTHSKKFQKTATNLHKSPCVKSQIEKNGDSEISKLAMKNSFNRSKINSINNVNKSISLAEDPSLYSITQLLGFIDGTENEKNNLEKYNKSLNAEDSEVIDGCSEDEVCPTPPKEVVKSKSEFIYRKQSGVNKSLDFNNCNTLYCEGFSLQGCTENSKEKLQPPVSELKFNQVIDESKILEKAKYSISSDDFTSKLGQKNTSFDGKLNSISMTENENVKCEPSPKITFDISFDLPFTQDDLECSTKEEMFDMNNAIIVESSSEENLFSSQKNDSVCFFKSECNENDKINNFILENSCKPVSKEHDVEICLPDEFEVQNSESLLSSVGNEKFPSILLKNILDKSVVLNGPDQNSKCLEEVVHQQNIKVGLCEVKEFQDNDFENSIFFQLLPQKHQVSTSIVVSESEKNKLYLNHKRNNIVHSTDDRSNKKFKEYDKSKFTSLEEHHVKSTKNVLQDNLISDVVNNVSGFSTNSKHTVFNKDKFCFDLSYIGEETSKFLSSKISQDFSQKHVDLEKQDSGQNIEKNKITLESIPLNLSHTETKEKQGLKSTSKKSKLQKTNTYEDKRASFNKSVGKLREVNDEIMWEFDLCDEDKSFLLDLETKPHAATYKNQEQATFNLAHNSSDEFDLCNPNQSVKQNNPTELHSELSSKNQSKMSDASCSNRISTYDMGSKRIDQSYALKNKFSSRLRVKNKTDKTIFKNNSIIEDKDDFQFIRPIQKNFENKPSKKPSKFVNQKGKKLSNRNKFLLTQAEVSRSCGHESEHDEYDDDDEEDDDDDELEESFIDDESQHKMENTDDHAFYLKSLKDCAGLPQKYKLKAMKNNSFLPENEEYSEYQLDSFCVNDEDVIFLSSDDGFEHSPELMHKRHKLKTNNIKTKSKSLLRIVTHDSTTSSEHETSPKFTKCDKGASASNMLDQHDDNIIKVKKLRHKLVILSSDEEDEYAFIKTINPESHKHKDGRKVKNSKKAVIHDSSTSSEHEISPEVKKCIKKTSCNSNLSNDQHIDIAFEDKKISEFVVNSGGKNGNLCIMPNIPEFHTNARDVAPLSNNVNACSSIEPIHSSINAENLNFCVNFGDDVQLISTVNKKAEDVGSLKSSNLTHIKAMNSNESYVDTFLNNHPSTSRSAHSDLNLEKYGQTSEVCDEVKDISFDIAWDEVLPCISEKNKVSPFDVPNEDTVSCKSENVDRSESVILVDSRELASGKSVISALRNKRKVNPVVMSLISADYIISNQIAVERVLDSEFNSSPMPPKIIEKIKGVTDIFDKLVVIIEKDNRKSILSFNKNVTKCLQFVVHLNCHPSIKVLFSKSTDHTSELIFNLIQQEKRSGFHIKVPVAVNAKNQKLFDFYCSFPKMNPLCALNFMYHYPTVESLLKSSVEDLKKKGSISSHRAVRIHNYFRHEFMKI